MISGSKPLLGLWLLLLLSIQSNAQLNITNEPNAVALAQRLVGEGVSIANVRFTGNALMAGYFKNQGGTNINLDSGIVLTTGRAKTFPGTFSTERGLDGDGTGAANSFGNLASNEWNLNGDASLANIIGLDSSNLFDACVLEFDFIPQGDSLRFRYVFSSEEYDPTFACSEYNDAFAFFINGPGITGTQNIALLPGSGLPVSIHNVNNVIDFGAALCPANTAYYSDNSSNIYFAHDGHTTVLTAFSRVQPCQQYHLKLVISDVADGLYDSGVFLEAKSLTSNIVRFTNLTQTDQQNNSYLVEGCVNGYFEVKRPTVTAQPLSVNLIYQGTAQNGIDVQTLPAQVTIPANDSVVRITVRALPDNIPEGIETLKVYALSLCGSTVALDSTVLQIRDFDTLGITPRNAVVCSHESIQLTATAGYGTYQWNNTPGLSQYNIANPMASPSADSTTYICTAQIGSCFHQDSVFLRIKRIRTQSVTPVNCRDSATGVIVVSNAGGAWVAPLSFSIDLLPFQSSPTFQHLLVGTYWVKIKDATGCMDSMQVSVSQAFPDLILDTVTTTAASCSGNADGVITVTGAGGNPAYSYSINNGTSYQSNGVFNVHAGTNQVLIRDQNGCKFIVSNIQVPIDNTVTLQTGTDPIICEGSRASLPASSNGTSFSWTPTNTLSNANTLNPDASPVVSTMYYITATTGICQQRDSVKVIVRPAPVPDAGDRVEVCYGGDTQLHGSGGTEYEWSPSRYLSSTQVADPIVSQPANITYILQVTDQFGCHSLKADSVFVFVQPPARLYAGEDTSVAINQPLQLHAIDVNGLGFNTYHWSPGTGLNNPDIANPIATLTAEYTQFIVEASTTAHCIGTDTIVVKTYRGPEIYVPTSFTPNGDGLNDLIRAIPIGMKSFHYFRIFNRFGETVFSTTDERMGWNGYFKGKKQNLNTFVWIAEAVDYKGNVIQRKGTFSILF